MRKQIPALLVSALIAARIAFAEPPAAVMETLRTAVESLAEGDAAAFLDHFDTATLGLAQIRADIESVLASEEVSSTLELAGDEGKDSTWDVQLDWLLRIGSNPPRRALVKVRLEKKGRNWKFTRFDPPDFFRR